MDFLNLEEEKNNNNNEKIVRRGIHGDILIFDDFLSDYYLRELQRIVQTRLKGIDANEHNRTINAWHTSLGLHPYSFSHWSTNWYGIDFINKEIVSIIEKKVNKKLKVKRTYSSFQGPEEHGLWHTDDNEKNSYTFTLYLAFYKNVGSKGNDVEKKINEFCKETDVISRDKIIGYNEDYFLTTNESIFKIKNYTKSYSNDTFIPIEENDSLMLSNDKKRKMLDVLEQFRKDDMGGDFWWFNQGSNSATPFIINRGVFFPANEMHNGDTFRNTFYEKEYDVERIVVSFKLSEDI